MQNKKPIWLQQLQWKNGYMLDELIPNKVLNIDSYLIHHVSPDTNDFKFSRKSLAHRFKCSRSTVQHAINSLKHNDALIVTKNHIHFKGYSPLNKEDHKND